MINLKYSGSNNMGFHCSIGGHIFCEKREYPSCDCSCHWGLWEYFLWLVNIFKKVLSTGVSGIKKVIHSQWVLTFGAGSYTMSSIMTNISKSRLYYLWQNGRIISMPKPKNIFGKAILKLALFLLKLINKQGY